MFMKFLRVLGVVLPTVIELVKLAGELDEFKKGKL